MAKKTETGLTAAVIDSSWAELTKSAREARFKTIVLAFPDWESTIGRLEPEVTSQRAANLVDNMILAALHKQDTILDGAAGSIKPLYPKMAADVAGHVIILRILEKDKLLVNLANIRGIQVNGRLVNPDPADLASWLLNTSPKK